MLFDTLARQIDIPCTFRSGREKWDETLHNGCSKIFDLPIRLPIRRRVRWPVCCWFNARTKDDQMWQVKIGCRACLQIPKFNMQTPNQARAAHKTQGSN